jgi:hypothetical protein
VTNRKRFGDCRYYASRQRGWIIEGHNIWYDDRKFIAANTD